MVGGLEAELVPTPFLLKGGCLFVHVYVARLRVLSAFALLHTRIYIYTFMLTPKRYRIQQSISPPTHVLAPPSVCTRVAEVRRNMTLSCVSVYVSFGLIPIRFELDGTRPLVRAIDHRGNSPAANPPAWIFGSKKQDTS